MKKRIVTLLTDFGTKDGYTGCVKGVLKSHYPEVDIVDIAHDIDPFDIKEAAFALHNYYSYFPKGTIHIAIVDPGVGSDGPWSNTRQEPFFALIMVSLDLFLIGKHIRLSN